MLSFKKTLFGLVMMASFLLGLNADAGLTKTIGGNVQYQNNGSVNYVVSYVNTGVAPITVKLSDTLPTSLMVTPLSAVCDGVVSPGSSFVISQNIQTLSTNYCTLQPGQSATMNYSAMILAQSFSSIVNTANVALYSGSSFINNETASASFSSYPVLSLQKTFIGLNPQKINDLVTFKVKVINSGAAIANNIVLTDSLPNGFEYVSSTLPGIPSINDIANTVTWTIPTVPANSFIEYTITAKLNTSIPGAGLNVGSNVVNSANIATGTTTTPVYITFASGGIQSSASFRIAGFPSVSLTKLLTSPSNGVLSFSGTAVTYTITVTNTGTENAIGSIIDILPSELTGFSSSLAPSLINGNTRTWTGVTLAPGSTTTITVNGILGSNYSSSRVFSNTATFNYDSSSSTGGLINNGVATGLIQGLPNLVLDKNLIRSASAGQSGDIVVYSLTITNSSTTSHTGSRCLVDVFPSQVTLISSSLSQSNCGSTSPGQISFSGTTLPVTIILTGVINTNLSSGTVVTNSGTVALQTGLELISTDNTDSVSFTVGGSDLVLNKTVGSTTYTGTPGTPVIYTLQYINNGSLSISGVVLTDTLPLNLTYSTSSLSGANISGSTVSRNLGTLSPGQSGFITLTALISGYVEGGIITNTASLSSSYQEVNLQNNTSSVAFNVIPALSDVRIVKSVVSQGTYLSGTQYTFRFDVSNIGGLNASGVQITDILPNIFTYVSGSTNLNTVLGTSVGWISVGNTITSDMFSLTAGQSGYILLTAVLNNNILTTTNYTNTGTITSLTTDASLSNNVSSINGTITPPIISCSGLNYTITPNSSLLNPVGLNTLSGISVGYTYSLTNNLALPIESLVIGTTWPNQLSLPSSGLLSNIVASVSNIPMGSGVSYTLLGNTIVDGFSTLTTPATFTVKVAGLPSFTCNISSTISISQTCGNNVINTNLGEQCENYNGTVIVAPGLSFNATTQACDATCKIKTTKITNCAYMDVSGVIKNSCVDTTNPLESPLLTVKKYVNNQDAQDNNTAVSTSQGSTVNYRVVITNSSSFTAYNVRFNDVVPNGVTYITNSISPTSLSYDSSTKTLSGNLGNLAAGASITITFNATVDNSANGYVNNVVRVNYTDSLGTVKPEISDPAIITLGGISNTCNNGIKEGNEQCDLGNLPRTIGNYLDTNTNFPSITASFNHKGKICNNRCEIVDTTLGRCGDGILGRLEQCDLGGASIINNYLDNSNNYPAGVYNGQQCDASCTIRGSVEPSIPACWYTDSIISIMEGEYLPIALEIELGQEGLVQSCNDSNSNGKILESSLECEFKLFAPGDEKSGNRRIAKLYGNGCKDGLSVSAAWHKKNTNSDLSDDMNLFKEFSDSRDKDADDLFVQNPRLTDYIELTSSILGNNKLYGEYKLSLESVRYSYCKNGQAVLGNPYARVCQVNVAVTKPYLMQKGSVSSETNTDLNNFYMIDKKKILTTIDLDKIDKVSKISSTNLSSSMKTLTNNLIAKYEKIAVSATLSNNEVKKVPGKSIYIMNGGKTFRGADLTIPTTIIVKGDVNIEGNVSNNVLLIATGKVKFTLPEPDQWLDGCSTQVVNGIIVAQGGFAATPNNGFKNTNLNNPRCRKGNLQVYGVLVGNNLDDLVNSRRSHLEHWFTFKRNGSNITVNDSDVKAERRDEIYKGASVYIEQNPSLWRDMPPGSDEFLKTLNISRS